MAGKKKQGIAGLKDTTGGTRRDDRQATAKNYFEPVTVDAENVVTVVYMLRSPEGQVVLRAVASLDRFGQKAKENLELLVASGIMENVLPLIQHEDFLIRRFAIKLIALLSSLEEFRQGLLGDFTSVNKFVTLLEKEEDVVMHEFLTLTLAELSSECSAAGQILRIDRCVESLYLRLSSPDPDVQKNCLETMKNLLNEIDGVHYFLYSPHFSFKPILDLLTSKYPVIQIAALNVIEQFMSWSMDNRILSAFCDSHGLEIIIEIMENLEWTDLHIIILNIFLKTVDNPSICEYLQTNGCLRRMIFLLDTYTERSYVEKILGVLARVSQTDCGRKALHANDMGRRFGEYLQNESNSVLGPVCLGLASMAQYPPALDSILSAEPTSKLLDILTNSENEWKLREIAACALNVLSHEDERVARDLMQYSKFELLLPLLSGYRDVPVEVILDVLHIFIGITVNEKFRSAIINETVMKTIMDLIQDISQSHLKPARVQVVAMECLSGFVTEDTGRILFQALDGAEKLIECLKSRYATIRQWAALLVTQLSPNKLFVKSFIRHQGLQWLIDQRDMRYSAPSWESAIDAVFRAYLPAKFAFKGRLDLHDLTEEGFFILRRQKKLFFILDDLLELRASPAYPVYVANFGTSIHCPSNDKDKNSFSSRSIPSIQTGTFKSKEDKNQTCGDRSDDGSWDGSDHSNYQDNIHLENFSSCPKDPYLEEYLLRLRSKFQKEMDYSLKDLRWFGIRPKLIRERARILAQFVAEEMSGPDPNPVCKDHCLEMHLCDIRCELETNIIPVGHIRIGSYLERAFLFKVLADRIGLPCAFVRGSYGRAWVEIAIPVMNVTEKMIAKETQTSLPKTPPPSLRSYLTFDEDYLEERNQVPCHKETAKAEEFLFPPMNADISNALPTRLLKPNAIVDLMHEPGRIIPLNSYEADEYTGALLCLSSNRRRKCHD